MTEAQFVELRSRLDVIAGLLVLALGEDVEQSHVLVTLNRLGASAELIGQLLGMTRNNVNVSLHRARKSADKKPRPPSKKAKDKNREVPQ